MKQLDLDIVPTTFEQAVDMIVEALDDQDKAMILSYPTARDSYTGKLLTIEYFDLTDAGVPQFPVGVGFRMKEDA
jgi:hypothetical protein